MVGVRIRDARKHCSITQEELAQQVSMSLKHISAIECGIRTPSLDVLVAIANALQTDANTLLQDSLKVSPQIESSVLWEQIANLPSQEQKKILRTVQVLIEDT